MELDPAAFKKWQKWATAIKKDLHCLCGYQEIFRKFSEVIDGNTEHITRNGGQRFCQFVARCYGTFAAMAVRRHVKKRDSRSISLMRLLDQIAVCADQCTLAFYREQHAGDDDCGEWIAGTFMGFSGNGNTVSPKHVEQDMKSLRDVARNLQDVADRQIAHLDKAGCDVRITLDEIVRAVDEFESIARKYICFLTGDYFVSLAPHYQGNWTGIFEVPMDLQKAAK